MSKGMNNELEGLDTNYLRFSYLLLETRRNILGRAGKNPGIGWSHDPKTPEIVGVIN